LPVNSRTQQTYGRLKAEPSSHTLLDQGEFRRHECAQLSDQSRRRYGHNALRIEGADFEESLWYRHFESRPSHARCVRHQSDQSSIIWVAWNAENEARSSFCRNAEIG
jgi:hypothetical protein